jgi:hypothetical protein
MSAPSPDSPLWQGRDERLRHLRSQTPATTRTATPRAIVNDREAAETRQAEWTAAPPGRLGRRLLADVEPYLGFFAIAHTD